MVTEDGTPADPASYDYTRAARDALHFAALFDRFIQNLRRYVGYDGQYFAAIEPQRRLAPHVHLAIRGTITRAELRAVLAATYHQVWWSSTDVVRFDGGQLPEWHAASGNYVDPATGELLATWDEALDAIGPRDEPQHVARFGDRFDAQGVIAGSKDAARRIGYLTKYLTKHVADCHQAESDAQAQHAGQLADALRYEPCSPTCANWLRYGVQPKNAKPGLRPGYCKGKAHRREYLGTPDAASWSPANGPARHWLTIGRTRKPGCWPRLAPRPSTARMPGKSSPRLTRITCPCLDGCCMSWPTGPTGRPRLPKPDAGLKTTTEIFRQPGGQHDGPRRHHGVADDRGSG